MANNFASDPTCISLFNFDNGALTTDSIGTNTLTAENTPGTDTVNFLQGDASTSLNGSNQYFHRTDADLSSNFPGKNGTTNRKIAVFMRCKPTNNNYGELVAKWFGGNNSWLLQLTTGNKPNIFFYDGSTSWGGDATGNAILGGNWIDIGFSIDASGSGGAGKIKVWWGDHSTIITPQYWDWDTTGATTMNCTTGDFSIGFFASTYFTGLIDEVAIFNDTASMNLANFIAMAQGNYLSTPNYSREANASLPATAADLSTIYNATDLTNAAVEGDALYVSQSATAQYAIHEFKNTVTATGDLKVTWAGKSDRAPTLSQVVLEAYRVSDTTWVELTHDNSTAANTDFELHGTITSANLPNYKDGNNVVTCRVYQLAG